MIIRIPITDKNSLVTPLDPVEPQTPDQTDPSTPGDDGDIGTTEPVLPPATMGLTRSIPSGYAIDRYSYPCMLTDTAVPDADIPVVTGWFATTPDSGGSPSDTLVKRLTDDVIGGLKSYLSLADSYGFFTRPFKLGYALRRRDGKHIAHAEIRLVTPNDRAPLMLIRERSLSGSNLKTVTEIVNTPSMMTVSMPPFELSAETLAEITHLDFYATRQTDLLTGDEQVTAVRTYSHFGENVPGWFYPRRDADLVLAAARADTAYRIIASIPIADAMAGLTNLRLPSGNCNLNDWNNFEKLAADDNGDNSGNSNSDGSDNTEQPEQVYRNKLVEVGPLDLGYPELRKHVHAVTVRGIFPREPFDDSHITATLYGSAHRDRWHKIAESRGPHIRLLRSRAYRWLRVDIHAPYDALTDALTFTVSHCDK